MNRMMNKYECPLEIKELSDDGSFSGYGSVFGNVDYYGDVVEAGAFTKTLAAKMPAMLWQHDSAEPIGVWTKIAEDEKGLYMEGRLLTGKVARASEAHELLKAGAIKGLSIGYRPKAWEWSKDDIGDSIRYLKEIDLWEVSLVTFPANEAAVVTSVKSLESIRDIEETLRDAGFSRSEAKSLISRVKDLQREAEIKGAALEAARELLKNMKGM